MLLTPVILCQNIRIQYSQKPKGRHIKCTIFFVLEIILEEQIYKFLQYTNSNENLFKNDLYQLLLDDVFNLHEWIWTNEHTFFKLQNLFENFLTKIFN